MSAIRDKRARLAPWWRRVCAELIDVAIVAVIATFLLLIAEEHPLWYIHHGQLSARNIATRYVTVDIAALLYYPVLVWYTDGQTVGKRLFRIRVIRTDSRRIGLAFAAWREVGIKYVLFDVLAILPVVGSTLSVLVGSADVLWPLWDRENRALHDMVVGTRVVRVIGSRSRRTKRIGRTELALQDIPDL